MTSISSSETFKLFNKQYLVYIIVFAILEIINSIFVSSRWIVLLTIPQIVYVLFLLLTNKIEKALLWHIVFNVTACDNNTIDKGLVMLSYPSLKLIGPLTISYILLGLIWLKTLRRRILSPSTSLFYSIRKNLLLLFGCGTFLGIIGLLIGEYIFRDFITPFRYMLVAILYLDIFLRLYNERLMKDSQKYAVCLLISTPIASAISFFIFGASYDYSVFESFIASPIIVLSPAMLLYLIFKIPKNAKVWMIISLFCFFSLTITSGRGSQFITLVFVFTVMVYLVYFNKQKYDYANIWIVKLFFPLILIPLFVYATMQLQNVGENLASNKLQQFISLFSVFLGDSGFDLKGVAFSPYVRIAEVLNIVDNALQNPFYLLFGKGYGGCYTDSLGLFSGIDLSRGAFEEEAIKMGKFGTAHSMYPNVLLFHGVLGFILVIKMGIQYLKNIARSPLIFASFVLFLYSFYYNVTLLTACILFLFAAELHLKTAQK